MTEQIMTTGDLEKHIGKDGSAAYAVLEITRNLDPFEYEIEEWTRSHDGRWVMTDFRYSVEKGD
jgi:hypothetical protein